MASIILIVVFFASVGVGWNALGALVKCKSQKQYRESCRSNKHLIISIVLLVMVPSLFFYMTFRNYAPVGKYEVNASYSVYGCYEDKNGEEVEFERSGIAPLVVSFDHGTQLDADDRWEGYSHYYADSIKLDCFNSLYFDLDQYEIQPNSNFDYDIEYKGHRYELTVHVGDLSDNSLGYTWEEKLSHASPGSVIEFSLMFLMAVFGIVAYIDTIKDKEKGNA